MCECCLSGEVGVWYNVQKELRLMDIAALSMAMHQSELMQAVEISTMKKAMDGQEVQAQALLEMMNQIPPPSGHLLDVTV